MYTRRRRRAGGSPCCLVSKMLLISSIIFLRRRRRRAGRSPCCLVSQVTWISSLICLGRRSGFIRKILSFLPLQICMSRILRSSIVEFSNHIASISNCTTMDSLSSFGSLDEQKESLRQQLADVIRQDSMLSHLLFLRLGVVGIHLGLTFLGTFPTSSSFSLPLVILRNRSTMATPRLPVIANSDLSSPAS